MSRRAAPRCVAELAGGRLEVGRLLIRELDRRGGLEVDRPERRRRSRHGRRAPRRRGRSGRRRRTASTLPSLPAPPRVAPMHRRARRARRSEPPAASRSVELVDLGVGEHVVAVEVAGDRGPAHLLGEVEELAPVDGVVVEHHLGFAVGRRLALVRPLAGEDGGDELGHPRVAELVGERAHHQERGAVAVVLGVVVERVGRPAPLVQAGTSPPGRSGARGRRSRRAAGSSSPSAATACAPISSASPSLIQRSAIVVVVEPGVRQLVQHRVAVEILADLDHVGVGEVEPGVSRRYGVEAWMTSVSFASGQGVPTSRSSAGTPSVI